MAKTQRQARRSANPRKAKTQKAKTGVYPPMNIPELRQAFQHIESWTQGQTRGAHLVKDFQEEWLKTFRKPVDRPSAEAYIEYIHTNHVGKKKHQQGGMVAPLAGAPLDYTTRPGLYITPGVNQGS